MIEHLDAAATSTKGSLLTNSPDLSMGIVSELGSFNVKERQVFLIDRTDLDVSHWFRSPRRTSWSVDVGLDTLGLTAVETGSRDRIADLREHQRRRQGLVAPQVERLPECLHRALDSDGW